MTSSPPSVAGATVPLPAKEENMRIIRYAAFALLLVPVVCRAATDPPGKIDLFGGAEIFRIDTSHSYLGFTIRFLGMSNVRGIFRDYGATILYDDDHPERTSVTLVIDPASIDTGSEFRDKDLKSERFFDVQKYPHIVFQSTTIERQRKERYLVHGTLTIKGITREIAIPMTRTIRRVADTAWGNIRIGGNGAIILTRHDFNLLGNEFWGDKTIANEAQVTIEILASRPNYERWSLDSKEKQSIGEVALQTVEAVGAAAAAQKVRELKRDKPNDYNFGAGQLGIAINRLMQKRRIADALELLNAGRELYPDDAGFWARSGEAYATLGDRQEAIRMYEKAQALFPGGSEALEMLRRLRQ
jgi:polyisoprenoid-binding protein YceI